MHLRGGLFELHDFRIDFIVVLLFVGGQPGLQVGHFRGQSVSLCAEVGYLTLQHCNLRARVVFGCSLFAEGCEAGIVVSDDC